MTGSVQITTPQSTLEEKSLNLSYGAVDIVLPEQIEELDNSLLFLRRQIERSYQDLPWPNQIKKIAVLTEVLGGRGDVVAAAKVISVMQQMEPSLTFQWGLAHARLSQYDPISFLDCADCTKVQLLPPNKNVDKTQDFVIIGPVQNSARYSKAFPNIPALIFIENAEPIHPALRFLLPNFSNTTSSVKTSELYQKIHAMAFPDKSDQLLGQHPMGLQPGSGVLLDQGRIEAPLSRKYCCPSYLLQIQDTELRHDILEAMSITDRQSEPDYDQYSFNSGYAHHPNSWKNFIDCVAIHEHDKHVVIVLNLIGEFHELSTEDFQKQLFTHEHLVFLKQKGYSTVILKGESQKNICLQSEKGEASGRQLCVIVRPSFTPSDMRSMQLASERILATGDNSAIEAWCARCKLFLYEDVANMGCKWRFLQQQVDLAKEISPNLSELLALFGNDKRLKDPFIKTPLTEQQKMVKMEQLLMDPNLEDATLKFCKHITTNYSFIPKLIGALKRYAWLHLIPELVSTEEENLDPEFRAGLVAYIQDPKSSSGKTLTVRQLPELREQVHRIVQDYLKRLELDM